MIFTVIIDKLFVAIICIEAKNMCLILPAIRIRMRKKLGFNEE